LKHAAKYQSIKQWIEEKKAYLQKKEAIDSVNEAQLALSNLDSYEADKKDLETTPIPALILLGVEVTDAKYESKLSNWSYEKPDEIKSRENEIDSVLTGELANLLSAKRKTLEEDLHRELEKERLRLLFANQAGGLIRWAKALSEDIAGAAHFGSELEEVEAYQGKLEKEDKENVHNAEDKRAKAEETFVQATKLGVKENPYTEHKPEDLVAAAQSVHEACKKRQSTYAGELARVRENDKLEREFAGVANPLVEKINKNRDSVSESKASLEEQESHVNQLSDAKLGESELKTIQDIQGHLDSRGVTYNKHSQYVAKDVEVRLAQYHNFLTTKLKQIKENIQVNASRGITAEQLAEIERQFETFDKNKNKVLDVKEFKACLYSLGEERPTAEILSIMKEFGDGKAIPYEGFKKFMIKLFGDTNTKDEISNGFKLLAHDNEHVTEAQLAHVFPNLEDVAYLKQHSPAAPSDTLNYTAWTEAVFAR